LQQNKIIALPSGKLNACYGCYARTRMESQRLEAIRAAAFDDSLFLLIATLAARKIAIVTSYRSPNAQG